MINKNIYLGVFGKRLLFILIMLCVFLVGTLGFVNYSITKQTILENAKNHLWGIVHSRNSQIEMWFDAKINKITITTELPVVRVIISRIALGKDNTLKATDFLQEILRYQVEEDNAFKAAGIYTLDGNLIAGTGESEHFNQNPYNTELFRLVQQSPEPVFGNLYYHDDTSAALHLAKSITGMNGEPLAVMFFDVHPQSFFDQIMNDYTGLGNTGELFLADADCLMLTKSRNPDHLPQMSHKMETQGVLNCLKGKSGIEVYKGYDGQEVIGAYIWMPMNKWALVAEMHLKEALQPVYIIRDQIHIVLIVSVLLVLIATIFISRRLSLPLVKLAEASNEIEQGNLNVRIKSVSKDEFGDLTRQFNSMVKSIRISRQELETSNQQLLHSEKLAAVGRMVASIVHEMRNPLSTVKMNMQILTKKNVLAEVESEHLAIAFEQVTRLEKMLKELLEYSKPVYPNFLNQDLKPLLQKIKYDKSELLKSKQMEYLEEYPDTPIIIRSDSDILTRVFDNLISNAIQASPDNSKICVRMLVQDEKVLVEVEDHGKGMSPKVKDKLFERFFTTREDGVGLGMSNVKKFLDILGAEIEVDSVLGEGTTIRISLKKEI